MWELILICLYVALQWASDSSRMSAYLLPLPNDCCERLQLNPMTLSSGTSRLPKKSNYCIHHWSISCHVGKVLSWLCDWRKWKERVKGKESRRHFLFVSLWAWWEGTRSELHQRSHLLSGNVWKEVAISLSQSALFLQLLHVVSCHVSLRYFLYFCSLKFLVCVLRPHLNHCFWNNFTKHLWLEQINIMLCFRSLISVFSLSRWVEQQCWVLESGPWWRRATTWVCWLPAHLQSLRTPWSWLVAWWWWLASWAAAPSSGSRKAASLWWGAGPCLSF